MVYPCTRRKFLTRSAATAGPLALGNSPLVSKVLAADKQADMTIARWAGAEDPSALAIRDIAVRLTEQAIAGLGGMERFVKKGDVVWVKPNAAWNSTPEKAANTNPDVVATIVRLCFQAGAKKVKVGDHTVHTADKCYHNSGIGPAVKPLGAELVVLDESRSRKMAIGGQRIKESPLFPEVIESDLVINIPVVKHHMATTVTAGMKNYMGVTADRRVFHQDLPACIADITRFMKPRLCVVDAVRILTANGPAGGNLDDVATKLTVAAGVDIVALDAFSAELLGHKPEAIGTIARGAKEELGTMDYRSLALREIPVS